jgi:hypothetical protein
VPPSTDFDIGANGLTITLWFKSGGAITPIQPLLDKWDSTSTSGYSLYLDSWNDVPCTYNLNFKLNGNVIVFPIPITSTIILSSTSSIFPWYFMAVTVQNDTVTIYVNSPDPYAPSSLKGATDTTSVTNWQTSNTAPLRIAGNRSLLPPDTTGNNPYRTAIEGYPAAEVFLDEVEIFNRALGPTEMKSIYNAESIGLGKCTSTGVIEHSDVPIGSALLQSYPNPFNPTATIEYQVSVSSFVKLSVFDILGREVAILVNEVKPVGKYRVPFDGSNLPAGLYFYRIQAGKFQETRKLILLK